MFTISGSCSDLPPLMNGGITYTGGLADNRPINTVATFTCDNGYTLLLEGVSEFVRMMGPGVEQLQLIVSVSGRARYCLF